MLAQACRRWLQMLVGRLVDGCCAGLGACGNGYYRAGTGGDGTQTPLARHTKARATVIGARLAWLGMLFGSLGGDPVSPGFDAFAGFG